MSSQQIAALLNNTKSLQSSIDIWIDESQFYVHQTEIKLNLVTGSGANSTPTAGASSASVTVNTDSTIDLSKFNESITITPPANATPINDPTTIFGIFHDHSRVETAYSEHRRRGTRTTVPILL